MVKSLYFLGLDIGSTTSKSVVIDNKHNIVYFNLLPSGNNLRKTADLLYKSSKNKLKIPSFSNLICTGYGRHTSSISKNTITEISAHAIGSRNLFPNTNTIIDVGGQDSKIIRLDKNGSVIDFIMNDKCSSGCGIFFENMAKKLKIDLSKFDNYSELSKKKLILNNTCTVFAESEIISFLARKEKKEDIVRGLIINLANKIISIGNKIGFKEDIIFSGGVAKNLSLKKSLQKALNKKVLSPENPQITAALGAALYGLNKFKT